MTLSTLYRRGFLGVSSSLPVRTFVARHGWKLGVRRFVAGETLPEALSTSERLRERGLKCNFDLLGEFLASVESTRVMTAEILDILEELGKSHSSPYMSIKPTQLGLAIDAKLALENARAILARAQELGGHICLDMENFPFVEGTLQLYRSLRQEGYTNISTVLQSYLKRSMADLEDILKLTPPPTLRIVKGAYRESAKVAYQDKKRVDDNYREMTFRGLEAGAKINVATHDERIIREITAFLRGSPVGVERYEFQLLYGVKPGLQSSLAAAGHPVRIYLPFGRDWYGYFSRRLAERPANLWFVLRGLFG